MWVARCITCASTLQPAIPPGKIWSEKRRLKTVARISFVFLAGIPSNTKGVLISVRRQQITFGPQTNDKAQVSDKLGEVILFFVVAENLEKQRVFSQIVFDLDGLSRSKLVFGLASIAIVSLRSQSSASLSLVYSYLFAAIY
jgi:hypothetical protein